MSAWTLASRPASRFLTFSALASVISAIGSSTPLNAIPSQTPGVQVRFAGRPARRQFGQPVGKMATGAGVRRPETGCVGAPTYHSLLIGGRRMNDRPDIRQGICPQCGHEEIIEAVQAEFTGEWNTTYPMCVTYDERWVYSGQNPS